MAFASLLAAALGVNYYAFCGWDYRELKARGEDVRETIRRDVAHFRRIGFGFVRIHCLDRQLSDERGNLLANEYLAAQDYLVKCAAERGLRIVFTPISWWDGCWNRDKPWKAFSDRWTMKELTSDPEAWKVEANYLRQFVAHVNPHTGHAYGTDPAVYGFECINEPVYPQGLPDATVARYAETLAAAIRTGSAKPVYYNSWHRRNAALAQTSLDGVTGSCYPTGTQSGRALFGSQLGYVRHSTLVEENVTPLPAKARMIYEFDAADTPGAYMYPAFAKMFRSEGVEIANVFSYDPLPLAGDNAVSPTHYLNLVFTPRKAVSATIAAEVMKRVPAGTPYAPDAREIVFPPFRVSARENLSELNAPDAFMFTADTAARPVDPDRLTRICGVGSSSVASSSGTGAFFLDRVRAGVWKLQIYPSVRQVSDPYAHLKVAKRLVLPDAVTFSCDLPTIGRRTATLAPGEYTLSAAGFAAKVTPLAGVPEYLAPPPSKETAENFFREPGIVWKPSASGPYHALRAVIAYRGDVAGRFQLAMDLGGGRGLGENIVLEPGTNRVSLLPDDVRPLWGKGLEYDGRLDVKSVRGVRCGTGSWLWTPLAVPTGSAQVVSWRLEPVVCSKGGAFVENLFNAREAVRQNPAGMESCRLRRGFFGDGVPTVRFEVPDFTHSGRYDAVWMRVPADGAEWAAAHPFARAKRMRVRARACFSETTSFQLTLKFGSTPEKRFNIPLTTHWREIVRDAVCDVADLQALGVCFGKWLYPKTADRPHAFELEGVRFE